MTLPCQKRWRQRNSEYLKQYYKDYRASHQEQKKAYREKNREKLNARRREYGKKHKEELNRKRREYGLLNRVLINQNAHNDYFTLSPEERKKFNKAKATKYRDYRIAYAQKYAQKYNPKYVQEFMDEIEAEMHKNFPSLKCIFCGGHDKRAYFGVTFHEIHGNKHPYKAPHKFLYYLAHPNDFASVCMKHHMMVHWLMECGLSWNEIKIRLPIILAEKAQKKALKALEESLNG